MYIDGKCANELQPKLNVKLQKSAKVYTLEPKKSKTISGKTIKATKTEKTFTRNVKIGTKEKSVKVPVVNICIGSKCKDYGLDESVEISSVVYDLILVKDKVNLIPKGVPLIPPHEEDISKIELPPLKPMIQPKIKIATPSLSPMSTSRIFKIGFVIDRDTVPLPQASREEIQEAIRLANNKLNLHNTNIQFELQDITELNMGHYALGERDSLPQYSYIDNYYFSHASDPPNGVIIFREDPTASSYGGYSSGSSNLAGYGLYNRFESPLYGGSVIYGSVIDFDHMYAACGYDDNENHISDVPIDRESGDRECTRSRGIPCVFHNGYYMCSHIDFENDDYARTRLSFLANTIIHEFLHSFHPTRESLMIYHYGNLDCPDASCDVLDCFAFYSGMCPVTWEEFLRSWQYYLPYSENCMPEVDRCSDDTICEAWSTGNYRCSCLNNEACEYGRLCAEGRCKIPTGGECDTRRADLCITGHCTLTAGQRFKGTCSI